MPHHHHADGSPCKALPLVVSPDPLLKQKSQPVEKVDDAVRDLMDAMLETMYHYKGIGLAAVQVGVLRRILVVDVEQDENRNPGNPIRMVNPEIIESSKELSEYNEGCLSFPGQFSEVDRPEKITVRYLDENGEVRHLEAEGLLATCIQHEIDHLNGVTFVDHISAIKRDIILRKMKKAAKMRVEDE